MPANREVTLTDESNIDGEVTISANLQNVDSGVYYTDEELEFTIEISNDTNYTLTGPYVEVVVAIGDAKPEPFYSGTYQKDDIPPGETATIDESVDAMVLEGHVKVGIATPLLPSTNPATKETGFMARLGDQDGYEPLASFSVWDRDHYREIHERPQEMQEVASFTSLAVVFLAIIQVGTALGETVASVFIALLAADLYYMKFGIPEIFKNK